MSFSDTPAVVADELARRLRTQPSVVAVDVIDADAARAGRVTVEALAQTTDRGTVPNALTRATVDSSLGIVNVFDANAIGHKRVVIR